MKNLALVILAVCLVQNANAGFLDKNKNKAEEYCANLKSENPNLYSETKVSMFCGDLGLLWTKAKEFGSYACCVKQKTASTNSGLYGKSCLGKNQIQVEKLVQSQSNYWDKFGHCSFSCIIAYRCSSGISTLVGHGKEIRDLFDSRQWNSYGSGDWEADKKGITIYESGARSDQECMNLCYQAYPKPVPVVNPFQVIRERGRGMPNPIRVIEDQGRAVINNISKP